MIVVWFKKDLRIRDHEPLAVASERGAAKFIYVYEDDIVNEATYSPGKHDFLNESLRELDKNLRSLGAHLSVFRGNLPKVFADIHRIKPINLLLSHQETGNEVSYKRDLRVKKWCKEEGVEWQEFTQTGVVRALKNRDGWSRQWDSRMNRPILPVPRKLESIDSPAQADKTQLLSTKELEIKGLEQPLRQIGGEEYALSLLESFLAKRGQKYSSDMSSPLTAEQSCSRLSSYLAFGNVSIKSVYQATRQKQLEIKSSEPAPKYWAGSLAAFNGRLRWHCHFMQKLEDEPSLEKLNLNRGFDKLREGFNEEKFRAWVQGETGYPIVDACMKYLQQTGWINFRMRALLVSFCSYHLWLPWQRPSEYLGKLFIDFEPGIHYSQFQMQSGVTGINAIRIYSPAKQQLDQDPEGEFVKSQLPILDSIPIDYLGNPAAMPTSKQKELGINIGQDYPCPIVDHKEAYAMARQKIYKWRARPNVKAEAERVYKKHGSRKQRIKKKSSQSNAKV
ncbi:MAG: deoxyribodipyrimidine photo-lyase/cryptochrome family protein [Oligoflexales bacterium]